MQYRHQAEIRADEPRVASQLQEAVSSRLEQEGVRTSGVRQKQWMQFPGDGENDVKILYRQQIRLTAFDPLRLPKRSALWAVSVPAGVVQEKLVAAGVATVPVAAQGFRTAVGDRRQGPGLLRSNRPKLVGVRTHDVGQR